MLDAFASIVFYAGEIHSVASLDVGEVRFRAVEIPSEGSLSSKSVTVEKQAAGQASYPLLASLLDSLGRPLLIADRAEQILFANLQGRDTLQARGLEANAALNLFRDVLQADRDGILGQLERGEQEVNFPLDTVEGKCRTRIHWLPEPDCLAVHIEPVPFLTEAPADQAAMRQTVQDLMQEREITYRNLLAAYLRLQEANRQKTVFLASAAHELKTPLAVMKGYYDLLLSGSLGKLNDRQKEIVGESKESCDRLVRLVSMFLNYSALESGKLILQLRDNDLRDCIREITGRWNDAFQRANVRLEIQIHPDLPLFKFDYQKVQQCIVNLLDNALKHTPAGGCITLAAQPHFWERRAGAVSALQERRRDGFQGSNSILVCITDTGGGIAPEFHQEIFEEFVRVDPSSGGMGLGLAITKRLIQAHRGKVWVDSEVGRGSSFSLVLPLQVD